MMVWLELWLVLTNLCFERYLVGLYAIIKALKH